ncbi:MAG: DNA polymerase III subunit gamma/tau, partial [Proteobacteria bacterium]|nr:DNA polymerase III subunit gamma/tau [Pseudomonadota bacterium]
VRLAADRREPRLHAELVNNVHLVAFEPGRIEFRPNAHAPRDLASSLREKLAQWTGRSWAVVVSASGGAPTFAEAAEAERAGRLAAAADDATVRAVLDAFPGAAIREVREIATDPQLRADSEPGDDE